MYKKKHKYFPKISVILEILQLLQNQNKIILNLNGLAVCVNTNKINYINYFIVHRHSETNSLLVIYI